MGKYFPLLMGMMVLGFVCQAGEMPRPDWTLTPESIEVVQGKVEIKDGTVRLDGTNQFRIPAAALGEQCDFTVEFELKRDPDAKQPQDRLWLFSNNDKKNKTGFGFRYNPPDYNCPFLHVNDGEIEVGRGFMPKGDVFYKLTFVVKDGQLQFFRDGLLLTMTSEINPSALPLTFGEITQAPVRPYELRNLRIYRSVVFPEGYDASVKRMRTHTGDQFTMLRAPVDDPTLPRILVIGDSISMGYRGFISEHFKGRAYVDYWIGGTWFGADSVKGDDAAPKRAWRGVYANGPYDVVSWNAMTLHMWNTNLSRCPEESLEPNMTEMVKFIKGLSPATTLLWVRCTPWRNIRPDGTQEINNPVNDRIVRYNKIVDGVMEAMNVPEIDLYAIAEGQMGTVPVGSKDVLHWNNEVSKLFAAAISKRIEEALAAKKKP